MNKEQLTALVAEILDQMAPQVKASEYKAIQPLPKSRKMPITTAILCRT